MCQEAVKGKEGVLSLKVRIAICAFLTILVI